jgi:chromate transporter
MQAVFYGIGSAVIGIIAISSYKLSKKSLGRDWMLWSIAILMAAITFITEKEILWLIIAAGICSHPLFDR